MREEKRYLLQVMWWDAPESRIHGLREGDLELQLNDLPVCTP